MKKPIVIVFGAGKSAKSSIPILKYTYNIKFAVDNDYMKWGGKISSIDIRPPHDLDEVDKDTTIIVAVDNYNGVVKQLTELGFKNIIFHRNVYTNLVDLPCWKIMDRNIPNEKGQYTPEEIKNNWMNHINCIYDPILDKFHPGKILDVGCGCGRDLFHFLCTGVDAVGIDCEQWKLEFLRQKIIDFRFPEEWNNRFSYGVGESLPFKDDTFDMTTSNYVLEHVDNWKKCLCEMYRVTKHGGKLCINAPDYRNSYEEHYGVDIGAPIVENTNVLKQWIIDNGMSLDIYNGLNFITKPEIISELLNIDNNLIIKDLEDINPRVERIDGKLKYSHYVSLIVYKP